ncbi:hypothetical protein PIB30_037671 [Stylosanthes scabra]|uniref:Josephin-like protein n=1 Tax=Stylosanthes scabra TaxID=79078 RepID=A0ABU6UH00_9FABA|nr:hypothetical protein [Stylosanthes scabra]
MQIRIRDTKGEMDEKTSQSCKNSSQRMSRNRNIKSCICRIPWQSEFSPAELVKDIAERVTKSLRLVPLKRSLHRGSTSLGRSKSERSSVDSYRTAAVEDCIEFIHSSFSRSNSSTATSRQDSIHGP